MRITLTTRAPVLLSVLVVLAVVSSIWLRFRETASVRPEHVADGSDAEAPVAVPPVVAVERREMEEAPAGETVAETGQAEVEVRDEFAGPLSGATVFACGETRILWQGETGPEGVVRGVADSRTTALVVAVAGRALHREVVDLTPGRHVIELVGGERIGGAVRFEDGVAAEGIPLFLVPDHRNTRDHSIPEAVWSALGLTEPWQRSRPLCRSSTDGSFAFHGLPAHWTGLLRFDTDCRIRDTSHGVISSTWEIRLGEPATGMTVVLAPPAELFFLRGRLLEPSTWAAAPGVEICAELWFPGESAQRWREASSDDGGRFAIALARRDIERVSIHVGRSPPRDGSCFLELESAEIPEDLDLGDIKLPVLRDVHFLLQDLAGQPIAGGTASMGDLRSKPSDSEGRGTLGRVPPEAHEMRVVAEGVVPTRVELPDPLPALLVVTLEPASNLEVSLVTPVPVDRGQFLVLLFCDEGLFQEGNTERVGLGGLLDHVARYWPPFEKNPEKGLVQVSGAPDEAGVARFRALHTGRQMTLRVAWRNMPESVLHEEILEPLRIGETRRHVVELGEGSRHLHGTVVDQDGDPLASASLNLGRYSLGQTDESGAFSFLVWQINPSPLRVRHPAGGDLYLPDFMVPEDGSPLELVLGPSRTMEITVVDTGGNPMPDAKVFATCLHCDGLEHRYEVRSLGEGRFLASRLSDLPFRIAARLGGRLYSQDHGSPIPEARIVVPEHGSVVVRWQSLPEHEGRGVLELELRATGLAEDLVLRDRLVTPGRNRAVFSHVYPTTYSLSLLYLPSAAEKEAGRETQTLHGPVPVQVQAAVETTVDLPGR